MGILEELAFDDIPLIFAELAVDGLCETVNILSAGKSSDGYGNDAENHTPAFENIPALREPHKNGNPRYLNGGEWTSDKFMIPASWEGAEIEIKATDKLQRLAGGIATPEKIFTVAEVRNYKVYYEVITTIDRNED